MITRSSSFKAIGTTWDIHLKDMLSDDSWTLLLRRLHARIESFDKSYSRFRPDSLVSKLYKQPGSRTMTADGFKMVDFYHRLYTATSGKVTPLIGQTMIEAGYDSSYSLKKKTLHTPPSWDDALSYNQETLETKMPVLFDFGAAGKGYLVDILGEIIEDAGVQTYTINAGGDIRRRSSAKESVEIGLENPNDITEAIAITKLTNGSLCASSGSKRKWQDLNHIIDPFTLKSPSRIIATWVIATDTMTADGLATALFFTEPEVLQREFNFSYALLFDDMSLQHTNDFNLTVFKDA